MKLQQVNTRLFSDDIKELKRLAKAEMLPWQVVLRRVVHDAIQAKKEIVIR